MTYDIDLAYVTKNPQAALDMIDLLMRERDDAKALAAASAAGFASVTADRPTELVEPSVEMVREAALAIERARGIMSFTGEPGSKALADACAALSVILPEGCVVVPREQLREWYTAAFAMFCAQATDNDFGGPTPRFMAEMEAMLAAAPISAATSGKEGGR